MTISTAYASLSYAGAGAIIVAPVTWPFFDDGLVVSKVIVATGATTTLALGTDYTFFGGTLPSGLPSTGTVTTVAVVPVGTNLIIDRITPRTQGSTWNDNDPFPEKVVEAAFDRLTLMAQESLPLKGGALDAAIASASASATAAAAASAATAATQAGIATTQASNASASAATAATQAGNAAASAATAATQASTATAQNVDLQKRYLGAKASDPTLDNGGLALITGASYFNTTTNDYRIYNSSSAWVIASGVDGFTGRGDANYTILATDRIVGTNAAFTASRTWTLPAANALNAGRSILVADFQGTVTGANTLVISRAGANTINGGTSVTLSTANNAFIIVSDGISKWSAQAVGATTLTGDVTGTGAGSFALTIAANAVTNAKAAQMATLTTKGNNTGSTANAVDMTSAQARIASGVDRLTGVGDTIYTILATDRCVGTNAAFTASRTWTLPAANGVNAGHTIVVSDFQGTVTGTNTLVISRAGADTINGGTTVTISTASGAFVIISDGSSKWSAQAIGSAAVSGVSTAFGRSGAVVATAGDYTLAQLYSATIIPQGRLTLTTLVPVMTTGVTGATSVLYTPYVGRFVPIYDGTRFTIVDIGGELTQTLADTTKSPAAVVASTNYDMFVWNDAGTIRCTRGPTWNAGAVAGSDILRGTGAASTELQMLNGVLTNKNAITNGPIANKGTYVGTIRTNASSTVDYLFGGAASGGTAAVLNVWNAYNRVLVQAYVKDNGVSYTYSLSTIRSARASNTNRISFVMGLAEDGITSTYLQRVDTALVATAAVYVLIGLDQTTAFGTALALIQAPTASGFNSQPTITWLSAPLLGSHFLQALESSDGTNANTINVGSEGGLGAMLRM